jgi:hypothetical protein
MAGPDDPLLAALVDDAALFPPGNAPMAQALREHEARKDEPMSGAVGAFVCAAARVGEMVAARAERQALLVSLVLDPSVPGVYDAVRAADAAAGVVVIGIEAPLAALGEPGARVLAEDLLRLERGGGPHLGFLEVPRDASDAALDLVGASGWHAAKYRTGGVTAAAHPSEAELAHFVVGCEERRLRFKLTAGLHHAVRTTTAEGFEQHGVLNILVGVALARQGADRPRVAEALAERDSALLVKEVRSWTKAEGEAVRSRFLSFGCCGVEEPLGELRALGVLEDERARW